MPRLAFNLLAWSASISDDLFPTVERLAKIGYDGIEICMGQQEAGAYKRMAKHLRNLNLDVTCVTILGAEANPVSPDKAVRAKALEALKWNIDRSVDVGSSVLCGPFHSAFATFTRSEPKPEE